MFEKFESQEKVCDPSVFNEYFLDGKIDEINYEEVPEIVMQHFESKSSQFILPEDYKPKDFEKFFVITNAANEKTFLAQQTKKYSRINNTERLTYFAELRDEEIVSRAVLRFNIKHDKKDEEYFKNKPFVGGIKVEEGNLREGLATDMLLKINAYSQMLYKLPAYSDTLISKEAKPLLEKFTSQGKAKKFKEGEHDRYVMQIEKKSDQ